MVSEVNWKHLIKQIAHMLSLDVSQWKPLVDNALYDIVQKDTFEQ